MISVIIPVYNVAPYLRASLDSLLAQTYADWEAICVDDGSTDGCATILDEYAAKDSRIKVIHQINCGVSAARNKGLDLVRGDYVMFVDSDDLLRSDVLTYMMGLADTHSTADMLTFVDVSFKDGEMPHWGGIPESCVVDVATQIPSSVARTCVWGVLYKRDSLPQEGFRPYSRGEDILYIGQCLAKANQVVLSSYIGYGYRVRTGSAMTSRMTLRKLIDRIGYCRDFVDSLIGSGKAVDYRIYRGVGLNLTEGYVSDLSRLDAVERVEAWTRWYNMLDWMQKKGVFSPWTQFVVAACCRVKIRLLARLLCEMPHWLKERGLHR